MKRMILALVALLSLVGQAQAASTHKRTYTLAARMDLDGAAASATAIHSADAITDSASFTIDAQPDSPRLLVATLTDADSSVTCTYTVVGTTANGVSVTATTTLSGGSGAKVLAPVYLFATVTSASVGVCTGEGGGDTVSLGTSGNPAPVYFSTYGRRPLTSQDIRGFDFDWRNEGPKKITDSSSNFVGVDLTQNVFANLDTGDILQINVSGELFERVVTAKVDADTVTPESVVLIPDAGVSFIYRKDYRGPDDNDAVIPVGGFDAGTFVFLFHVLGNDAKVRVQCRILGAGSGWVLVDNSAITATATLSTKLVTVDFRLIGYDECRAGLEWATNDADGDAGAELEIITIQFVGTLAPPVR